MFELHSIFSIAVVLYGMLLFFRIMPLLTLYSLVLMIFGSVAATLTKLNIELCLLTSFILSIFSYICLFRMRLYTNRWKFINLFFCAIIGLFLGTLVKLSVNQFDSIKLYGSSVFLLITLITIHIGTRCENCEETTCGTNTHRIKILDSILIHEYTFKPRKNKIIRTINHFVGLFFKNKKEFCIYSSVYVPSETKRGDWMMTQVFLYKEDEECAVACKAAEVDPDARRKNYTPLSVKLNDGDIVKAKLTMSGKGIEVDEPIQEMIWQGHYTDCQFGVFVPEDYKPSSMMGTVMLAVNDIPCGRMMFKTKIVTHIAAGYVLKR